MYILPKEKSKFCILFNVIKVYEEMTETIQIYMGKTTIKKINPQSWILDLFLHLLSGALLFSMVLFELNNSW